MTVMSSKHYVHMTWLAHRLLLLILLLVFGTSSAIAQPALDCKPGCGHCQKQQKQVSHKSCCDKSSAIQHHTNKPPSSALPQQSCCQGEICTDMALASTGLAVVGHFAVDLTHPPTLLALIDLASFPNCTHLTNSGEIPPLSLPLQQLYCVYLI